MVVPKNRVVSVYPDPLDRRRLEVEAGDRPLGPTVLALALEALTAREQRRELHLRVVALSARERCTVAEMRERLIAEALEARG